MPLRAYCEERFRITVSLGPGSALGEKGKKRGQIGKNIGERSKPSTVFFFLFSPTSIFSPFAHNTEPGPRQQEGILYAHASIWAVEVPQRHFM